MNRKADMKFMETAGIDAGALLRVPLRVFLFSDFFAYTVNIPLTVLVIYFVLPIRPEQRILYFSIVVVLVLIAISMTLVQIRKDFLPVTGYFRRVIAGEAVSDEEYVRAQSTFFSMPRKRVIQSILAWCLLMPAAIAFFCFSPYFLPTLTAKVVMLGLFAVNVITVGGAYYLSIAYQVRKVSSMGLFNRRVRGAKTVYSRLSVVLSAIVIALMGLLCAIMVPASFIMVNGIAEASFVEQMKQAVRFVDDELKNGFRKDDGSVREDLVEKIRSMRIGRTGYPFVFDSSGRILVHRDEPAVGKNIGDYAWGDMFSSSGREGSFRYDSGNGFKIGCFQVNGAGGYTVAAFADTDEYEKQSLSLVIFMTVLCGAGFLVIGSVMYWFVAMKLKPLKTCRSVIDGMGDGTLCHDLACASQDEVGGMMKTLDEYSRKLIGIIRTVQSISQELAASSEEMSETAVSFADNAQNQAASSEQGAGTAKEIIDVVEHIASNAGEQYGTLNLLMENMKDLATCIDDTGGVIRETVRLNGDITQEIGEGQDALQSMNETMARIAGSSREMMGIVGIINEISERINLLSLNASIEAARAGEAGRGFAVVANEISKLADATASSIKEIDRFIGSNINEIDRGKRDIDATSGTIMAIIDKVDLVRTRMEEIEEKMRRQVDIYGKVKGNAEMVRGGSDKIKTATVEQRRDVHDIVAAILHMNDLSQAGASGAEEISGNAERLAAMAETLKEEMEFFKI